MWKFSPLWKKSIYHVPTLWKDHVEIPSRKMVPKEPHLVHTPTAWLLPAYMSDVSKESFVTKPVPATIWQLREDPNTKLPNRAQPTSRFVRKKQVLLFSSATVWGCFVYSKNTIGTGSKHWRVDATIREPKYGQWLWHWLIGKSWKLLKET